MSTEAERLRILEQVSNGELTPQQGQLEIAILKTRGSADEAERPEATYEANGGTPQRPPSLAPFMALLALPVIGLGVMIVTGLTFFLALPAYVLMSLWNAYMVPAIAGAPVLSFFSTLAGLVVFTILWTAIGWGRRLRLAFQNGRSSFVVMDGRGRRGP